MEVGSSRGPPCSYWRSHWNVCDLLKHKLSCHMILNPERHISKQFSHSRMSKALWKKRVDLSLDENAKVSPRKEHHIKCMLQENSLHHFFRVGLPGAVIIGNKSVIGKVAQRTQESRWTLSWNLSIYTPVSHDEDILFISWSTENSHNSLIYIPYEAGWKSDNGLYYIHSWEESEHRRACPECEVERTTKRWMWWMNRFVYRLVRWRTRNYTCK